MDQNKLQELRNIGYEIPGTCGICKHGTFPKDSWGTCEIKTYEHLKHSDKLRHLSIYKTGRCNDSFELDQSKISSLGAFIEFIR